MADGRPGIARERLSESPATTAGLSASGGSGSLLERWRGAFSSLGRPALEETALRSYRRERLTELTLPIAGSLMEGGFIGVIADKVYHVHPALLALVGAAPMAGLLSSFLWARVAYGRRKVPIVIALQACVVFLVACVAFLPAGSQGGWLLVACMVVVRLLMGGVITIRSLVWTLNYRREFRARVTARLSLLTTLTMTVAALLGSRFLDSDPTAFRTLYALGAAVSTFGVLAFSGVRLIGEEEHVELERRGRDPVETVDPEPSTGEPALRGVLAVLRSDRLFARYQACQFLLGVSNMMIEAPLIYLVSRQLEASYTTSIALTLAIPLGISSLTLPLWAAYIDRVHIAEFRARHSWTWVVAQFFTWVGAVQGSLWWIGFGRVLLGFGRGGGSLAWQIGHNDFARRASVTHYMGAHVTLTGIRGAFAPFLGMALYVGWSAAEIPGLGVAIPAFSGIGGHLMLVCCMLSTTATLGYMRLHRRIRRRS